MTDKEWIKAASEKYGLLESTVDELLTEYRSRERAEDFIILYQNGRNGRRSE